MVQVWGTLEKSQEDPETIEDAINRLIDDHNDNPDAHIGTGQSLQSHKASVIIDHAVRSFVSDKLADNFNAETPILGGFQSLDSYTVVAYSQMLSLSGLELYTSNILNNYTYVSSNALNIEGADDTRSPRLSGSIKLSATGAYTAYYGMGKYGPTDDDFFVGFKIVDGTIYGNIKNVDYSYDKLVELGSFTENVWYKLTVSLEYGVAVRFYINDVQAGSITTDPTYWLVGNYFSAGIRTQTTGQSAWIYIKPFVFYHQDL